MTKPRKKESKREIKKEIEFRRLIEEQARRALSDATGAYRPDVWRDGIAFLRNMKVGVIPYALGFGGGGPGSGALLGAEWTQIGPAPLRDGTESFAGRVIDMAIDPSGTTDQNIFIATWGGIWKSTDGGSTWAPKTDRLSSIAMGAVAIDPNNPSTIYAGAINNPPGPCLFKSIDAGETWFPVGGTAMQGQYLSRILVTSSGAVLVGTFNNGLYRSIAGGATFGNNSPSYNNNAPILTGTISDLHGDTQTGSTVYACIKAQGLFVSTDNGATFPTNLFSNSGAPVAGSYGTVRMSQSTLPDGKTIYTSVAGPNDGSYLNLYKSTTAGSAWSVAPGGAAAATGGYQFGTNQTVGVDPQDPKVVYLGFQDVWHSTDGGTSFVDVSSSVVHADQQTMGFSPASHWVGKPTRLYVGTDGGFATTASAGSTWTNLNEGVATLMIHDVDIGRRSPTNNQYSYCTSQDNGISVRRPGMSGTDWAVGVLSDAWHVAVDPANPQNAFSEAGSFSFNFFERTSNGGLNWTQGATGLSTTTGAKAVDPNNGMVVYAAGGAASPDLYQSTNGGMSFTKIHTFPNDIACIGTVSSDSNQLWVGFAFGEVWKSADVLSGAGSIWTSVSSGIPQRVVSAIAVDPLDPNRVVITLSGVSGIQPPNLTQHVYLTQDGGMTWNDVSGTNGGNVATNLPDRSFLSVAINPGSANGLCGLGASGTKAVAVGQSGICLTSNDGATWVGQLTGVTNTLADVVRAGSQFVAVGIGGAILTSPDGITWTVRKSSPSWEALQGIAWSGSTLVASSASLPQVYTSPDGVNWTLRNNVAPQALLGVVFGSGQFVAVGYGGTIITSPDGISWTTRNSPTTDDLVVVIWAQGQYVAGGLHGTILTSPDGIVWTQRTSPTTNEINGLASSGSAFVGVINTGEVIRSPDGINWSIQSSSTPTRLLDIIWFNGMFVAVGDFAIITSPDGSTWTDHSFGDAPFAIIAGSDTTIFSSVDKGAMWTVLGVGLPNAPCRALALDWTRTPSLLRAAIEGRSVFELTVTSGARVAVVSNLGFGAVALNTPATLIAQVFNIGSAPLTITSFTRISGSSAFTLTGPLLPLTLQPGTEADFTLVFQPTTTGNATAIFQIASNDLVAPTVSVPMSGIGA